MIKFGPEHVGLKVWSPVYGNGKIISYESGADYPIVVIFEEYPATQWFTECGYYYNDIPIRSLFVGHDLEITVNEDPLPEPALICPACRVEHEIEQDTGDKLWSFEDTKAKCPFFYAEFNGKEQARGAMKAFIAAMKGERNK